jgi:hypothetical protein
MEEVIVKDDEHVSKILNNIVSMCKQTGLPDLAVKCNTILKNYEKSKAAR